VSGGEGETGKGLSSKWSAGNQILFISLRAALLFNDGVGITLWLAVDGKLFTVSLVAMKRESERERERGREEGEGEDKGSEKEREWMVQRVQQQRRVQRTLGRAYATMYQGGEKKDGREWAREA